MTHLSTLGSAVMAGMDVERVTRELKARSSGSSRRSVQTSASSAAPSDGLQEEQRLQVGDAETNQIPGRTASPNPTPSESSLASSAELSAPSSSTGHDTGTDSDASATPRSDGDVTSTTADSFSMLSTSVSTNAQSWVEEFNSQLSSSTSAEDGAQTRELSMPGPSTRTSMPPPLSYDAGVTGSVTSDSLVSTSGSEKAHVSHLGVRILLRL